MSKERFETVRSVLLAVDYKLRLVKHKPGYSHNKGSLEGASDWRLEPQKVQTYVTGSESPTFEEDVTQKEALKALRSAPLETEDAYEDTISEAMNDHKM